MAILTPILALALVVPGQTAPPDTAAQPQTPVVAQAEAQVPVRLEDVVVDARRLEEAAEDYVDLVAAPVRRRGLARWKEGVCVGVANLRPEVAQPIIDRVSDVARSLGLRAHEPECNPSILIIATTGASAFAEDFVARRPRLFRVGATGMDRGSAALRDFIHGDRPVRWWHVSLPVDSETGMPIVRFPGQVAGAAAAPSSSDTAQDYAPITAVNAPSRLNDQYEDVLKRVFIIVDVDRLQGVGTAQLADYLAMVAMAQIDPDADAGAFDSILNLFGDPAVAPPGLTGWDRAYLEGLYDPDSEIHRINQRAQVQAVAAAIATAYRNDDGGDDEEGRR